MAVEYYNANAEEFFARTVDADMSELQTRFAARLPPGGRVLDAGCGSGRDARAFREMGLQVSAIDGSAEMAKLARAYAGIPVQVMDFREVAWREAFDGIWACASLLHLKPVDLPGAVRRLRDALVPGGHLEMSFQYGDAEGVVHGRWFTNLDEARAEALIARAGGLRLIETSVNGDSRPDRAHTRWLRVLCARIELDD
jgi:SAM-dependent methyltransferase